MERCGHHPTYDPTGLKPPNNCRMCWKFFNWAHRKGLSDVQAHPAPLNPDNDTRSERQWNSLSARLKRASATRRKASGEKA